jgi:iduronate 2-sulfatase
VVDEGSAEGFDSTTTSSSSRRKNVLFLITDDLRPSLSAYDVPHVVTPNFDRLARMSTTFERAYNQARATDASDLITSHIAHAHIPTHPPTHAQDPICNPSRNSLLSGRRPDTTRVWLFEAVYPKTFVSLYHFLK